MKVLKDILEKRKDQIEFWTVNQIQTKRREVYLCQGAEAVEVNQSRMVEAQDIFLEVWVKKPDQTLGSTKGRILATDPIEAQVEKILNQAQLASEKAWTPMAFSAGKQNSDLKACSPQFIEDFDSACENLKQNLMGSVQKIKDAQFNSSELFCTMAKHQRWSSNGFETESLRSKIYGEVCFSATDGKNSDEFLVTTWAVRPEDMNFSDLCAQSVEGAQGLLKAKATPAGEYFVQLNGHDVGQVLETFKERTHGASKYYQMPYLEKGEDLIPNFEGQGFEMKVNPLRDWAINSSKSDFWGRPSESVTLASNNKVQTNLFSQKFAQYLSVTPTVEDGVLEVHPKASGNAQPKVTTPVLHILQFSGLFISPSSQTFSSEIRLGKIVNPDGSFEYVKGGNLSGSIKGNFSKVQWGTEMGLVSVEGEYSFYGPTTAILNNVSVS